ncbi:pecanex-like protein 4 [Oratosquilla oratoria]|uniref:pecanex-like protein 4 n=1 Tax=Oratosquilla oratoria TaxID=337810 RepID=UPI003F774D21
MSGDEVQASLNVQRASFSRWQASMESPLVNDYKKPFIYRRILETFLGGLRLILGDDVPFYVFLFQVLFFIVPPVMISTFISLHIRNALSFSASIFSCGATIFIYAMILQLLSLYLRSQKSKVGEIEQVHIAIDEEVLQFDSLFGPKTWSFIIPKKKFKLFFVIHPILCGILSAASVFYLSPLETQYLKVEWGWCIAFTGVGVATYAVAIWPMIGGPPAEPATFHPLSLDFLALSRCSHILTCVLVHYLARTYSAVYWLYLLDCTCHVLFTGFTLLWVFGILPPIDAYLFWILEQWQVIALGGSPCATDRRLVLQCFFGTMTLFAVAVMPTYLAMVVVGSIRGYLLSIDIPWLISSIFSHKVKIITGISGKYEENRPIDGKTSLRRMTCSRELVLYFCMFILMLILTLGINLPHQQWYENVQNYTKHKLENNGNKGRAWANVEINYLFATPSLFKHSTMNIVGGGVILIAAVMLAVNEIQKVYIFGILRNPVFIYHKEIQQSTIVYIFSQFLLIGAPYLCFLLVNLSITANMNTLVDEEKNTLMLLLKVIPFARAVRYVWQFPHGSLIQLSIFYIIEIIIRQKPINNIPVLSALAYVPATRIFLVSIAYLWMTRFLQRIWSVMLFMITAMTDPKQRKIISLFLVGFNIGILPFLIVFLAFSAAVAAPLLPLFTLPLFLLGYPRPLRSWSYPIGRSANSCEDSVYYEQLTPHIAFAVHSVVQSGSLGHVEPGEHFLLRWEDRLLWIQIVECGLTHCYYSIKGLELQETSCHTAEASRVDNIFSHAFDVPHSTHISGGPSRTFNQDYLHTLTPLTKISVIGYSDIRNVLTGVIDSLDTLKKVEDYFYKSLLWLLLDDAVQRSYTTVNEHSSENLHRKLVYSAHSRNQDGIKSLPEVDKKAEVHFEVAIPKVTQGSAINQDKISSDGSRVSRTSQSGRSSRMAWVDGHSIAQRNIIPEEHVSHKGTSLTEVSPPATIASWDDDEDPLYVEKRGKENGNMFIGLVDEAKNYPGSEKKENSVFPPILSKAHSEEGIEDANDNKNQTSFLPGILNDSSDDEENLSVHSINTKKSSLRKHHKNKDSRSAQVNLRVISRADVYSPVYNSPLSAGMAPLTAWYIDIPYDSETLESAQDRFPQSWYQFILRFFSSKYVKAYTRAKSARNKKSDNTDADSQASTSRQGQDEKDQVEKVLQDEALEDTFRLVVATCNLIIHGSDGLAPTPPQVYKTYNGEIPWSMALDWLTNRTALYQLVMKAYRFSVKLALDHFLVGPPGSWLELHEAMNDYACHWFMGPDSKTADTASPRHQLAYANSAVSLRHIASPVTWSEAVIEEVPNLFSIGYNPIKGVYTSHMLTLGEAEVNIGRLSGETVRALWASLSAELLYLTNDDDERYSIQAHPVLLRNLTIQAADPPLGYPIYSSPPLRFAVPWLNATFQTMKKQ